MSGRTTPPPGSDRRARRLASLLAVAASCALPPREIHLAPLLSVHRTAGGGREVEALAGIFRWRSGGQEEEWAIRPVFRRFREGERSGIDFLFPLGLDRADPDSHVFYFFPFGWWRRQPDARGRTEVDAAILPFLCAGRTGEGEGWFGLFPVYGSFRGFFTYDEFRWILFPLWVETRKEGGWRTRSLVWPIFAAGAKEGGRSLRAWPLFGLVRETGRRGGFVLWPIVLGSREEGGKSSFLFAPFFGKRREGDVRTTTLLWPFFGWARNDRTGFLVLETPWPLVRFVRRRKGGSFEADRVLPFYASTRSPGIRSRVFLWPIFWWREDVGEDYERSSFYVLPFFVTSSLERSDGGSRRLAHLWPLFHAESEGEVRSFRAPTLLPLPRLRGVYENWESLLALYDRRERGPLLSQRGFADLWRAESDGEERRWSVTLLAASRGRNGGHREWSFLAGLLRFRTGPEGFSFLSPSFPGPGFE